MAGLRGVYGPAERAGVLRDRRRRAAPELAADRLPGRHRRRRRLPRLLGTPDASLGEGRVWKAFPDDGDGDPPKIYRDAGEFSDDEYDTSDYEEPFDTSGEPPADGPAFTESEVRRPEDAVEAAREDLLGREVDR